MLAETQGVQLLHAVLDNVSIQLVWCRSLESFYLVCACIIGSKIGPLVIWENGTMGKTINSDGYCMFIVGPHLDQFLQEKCRSLDGYVSRKFMNNITGCPLAISM